MRSNKVRLVMFEGIDRSGKNTLLEASWKRRRCLDVLVNRGPISNMVYALKFDRGAREYEESKVLAKQLLGLDNFSLVYLQCDKEEFEKRIKETNHDRIDYDIDTSLYEIVFRDLGVEPIRIDSSRGVGDSYKQLVNVMGW